MNLPEDIFEFLNANGRCAVPRFGTFVSRQNPATLLEEDQVLKPPATIISFEEGGDASAEFLHFFAQKNHLDITEAEKFVTNEVITWLSTLEINSQLDLAPLGSFAGSSTPAAENFQPYPADNFFGLEEIHLPKINPNSIPKIQGPPARTQKKLGWLWWLLIVLLVLINAYLIGCEYFALSPFWE